MRERQRDTDTDTDTDTDRQTDRQSQTDRQRWEDFSEPFCTKVTMFRNPYSFHVSLLIRVLMRVHNYDNTKTQWQREKYTDYPNDSNSAYKKEKKKGEGRK